MCCYYVYTVSPVVQWDLPKVVGLHGGPINGSCIVSLLTPDHMF